jgi:hypothetical protein
VEEGEGEDMIGVYVVIAIVVALNIVGIIIGILDHFRKKHDLDEKWQRIESVNKNVGINRDNSYIDSNGYLRWNDSNRLCHRDVAFEHLYKRKTIDLETGEVAGKFNKSFSEYVVHHKNKDKHDNDPSNLEILDEEQHGEVHGRVIHENGSIYIRFCRTEKIYTETDKAILVAHQWIPKSQCGVKAGYLYISKWMYGLKFGKGKVGSIRTKKEHAIADLFCKLGRSSCAGCEFYNSFDKVCGK